MKSSVPKKEGPRAKTGGPSAAKVQAVTRGGPPKEIDEDTTKNIKKYIFWNA
jgi:hypothetical protein